MYSVISLLCMVYFMIPVRGQEESYSLYEYPNPLTNPGDCGRNEPSYICDPNNILKAEEALQLESALWSIRNQTMCPCSSYVCQKGNGGYKVGIAILKKIKPAVMTVDDGEEENQMSLDNSLHRASLFAYSLLDQWDMGTCREDVIIVYSVVDNVFYTMTGKIAGAKLTRNKIGYIAMNTRPLFRPSTAFEGLFELVKQYKAVFLGVYRKPDYALPKAEAVHGDASFLQQGFAGMLLPLLTAYIQKWI